MRSGSGARALLGVTLAAGACSSPSRAAPHAAVAPTVTPARTVEPAPAQGPVISASPARHVVTGDASCGGGHMAALQYLPATATALFGIDAQGIVRLPFYAAHRASLEVGGFKRLLDVAGACDVGLGAWQTLTIASEPATSNTGMVVRVAGIGGAGRLECLRKEALAHGGEDPFTLGVHAGRPELTFDDGTRGWVVDACTIVIASEKWIEPTRARIGGQGPSLLDSGLVPVVARAGEHRHVWAAAKPVASMFGGTSIGGAQDLALSIDLHGGFALNVSLAFPDGAMARTGATELRSGFDGIKGMLGSMGVPQAVAESVGIAAAGSFVTLTARGSEADLDAIRQRITTMIAGTM